MPADPEGPPRPARRWPLLGVGGGVVVVVACVAAWRLSVPARLGLERPRVVLVSGDASVDDGRARAMQTLSPGAAVHTGHGSTCFSIRASRVCLGADSEVRLAELGANSATIEARRGTVLVASAGDDLRVTLPAGGIGVHGATVSIEDAGGDALVRVLEGSASMEASGRPSSVLASPGALGLRDGRKRPPAPALEDEERGIAQLARRWQGTAGAVLEIASLHGRVEVDGADVGLAPATVLLDEGSHTLVVREGAREVTRETLTLKAGQKIVRGV